MLFVLNLPAEWTKYNFLFVSLYLYYNDIIGFRQSAKSELLLQNITKQNVGNYTCWAENIAGFSTKTVHVSVAGNKKMYFLTSNNSE